MDPRTLRQWQHEARMALNTHEAYPLPAGAAEDQRRILSLTTTLLTEGGEAVARVINVSPGEWAGLLARAFEQGRQAAYLAERDGRDGSDVPNPYGAAAANTDRVREMRRDGCGDW